MINKDEKKILFILCKDEKAFSKSVNKSETHGLGGKYRINKVAHKFLTQMGKTQWSLNPDTSNLTTRTRWLVKIKNMLTLYEYQSMYHKIFFEK